MQFVSWAVEGRSDEPVAEKLLEATHLSPHHVLTARGKTKLDLKLPGLNSAAKLESPWLVLRDLDHDDENSCLPTLHREILRGEPNPGMCFRIAVRAMESWLLADHENCGNFFGIAPNRIPHDVESLSDPKETLVNLCRNSKKRDIREGVVPRAGGRRKVGPEYIATVREFVRDVWDPSLARLNAPSLDRAMLSLERLRTRLNDLPVSGRNQRSS